jgi:hypothetical protein
MPPYFGPYFAAKAAEDPFAVSYAAELARFGIDTMIIVSHSLTTDTNHFVNASHATQTQCRSVVWYYSYSESTTRRAAYRLSRRNDHFQVTFMWTNIYFVIANGLRLGNLMCSLR